MLCLCFRKHLWKMSKYLVMCGPFHTQFSQGLVGLTHQFSTVFNTGQKGWVMASFGLLLPFFKKEPILRCLGAFVKNKRFMCSKEKTKYFGLGWKSRFGNILQLSTNFAYCYSSCSRRRVDFMSTLRVCGPRMLRNLWVSPSTPLFIWAFIQVWIPTE
jgi:hypothetical protein